MALRLSLLNQADMPAFVDVDDLAMKDYAYARAMVPEGQSRKEVILGFMRQGFKQDEKNVYLKITQHDELIAGAMWQFEFEGEKIGDETVGAPPVDATKDSPQDSSTDKSKDFIAAVVQRSKAFKAKFIGT